MAIVADRFDLPEGSAVLIWPTSMSDASLQDFEDWLLIEIRKIKRIAKIETPQPEPGRRPEDLSSGNQVADGSGMGTDGQ